VLPCHVVAVTSACEVLELSGSWWNRIAPTFGGVQIEIVDIGVAIEHAMKCLVPWRNRRLRLQHPVKFILREAPCAYSTVSSAGLDAARQ